METPDEVMSIREVCEFFGGKERPLDQSTIYRWVSGGRLPKPIRMTQQTIRWRKSDCQKAMEEMRTATQPPAKKDGT